MIEKKTVYFMLYADDHMGEYTWPVGECEVLEHAGEIYVPLSFVNRETPIELKVEDKP